ncbi:MAG: hypothetical protein ACRERS_09765, partial [Methylococcales bacterium]
MKHFRKFFLAGAMIAVAGSAAQATDAETVSPDTYKNMGFYLRADAGWSFLEWAGGEDDSAFAVGGVVGYRFGDTMRADVRVDYAGEYDVAPGADMSVSTVLGNLY